MNKIVKKTLHGLDVELITGDNKQWANCTFQYKNSNGTHTSFTVESHADAKIIEKARQKARQAGIPFMGTDPAKKRAAKQRQFEESQQYVEVPALGTFKANYSDKSHAMVVEPGEGRGDNLPRIVIPKSVYRTEDGKHFVQKWWWTQTLSDLKEQGIQLNADGSEWVVDQAQVKEKVKEREEGKQYVALPDLGTLNRDYTPKSHEIVVSWVDAKTKREGSWRLFLAKSICREENGKLFVPRWWVEKNMRTLEMHGYHPGEDEVKSDDG